MQLLDEDLESDYSEIIEHYWPLYKENKIGRSELRKELSPKYNDEEIQTILDTLSEMHLKGYKSKDVLKNIDVENSKTGIYLYLALGIILIITGIVLTVLLWQIGWFVALTFALIFLGLRIVFKANRKLLLNLLFCSKSPPKHQPHN